MSRLIVSLIILVCLISTGYALPETKIFADDAEYLDRFGWSVSISGDYAIVGAYNEAPGGVQSAGSAYIFHREDGNWTQQVKINADDAQSSDQFGYSVSISGDYAIVGAYQEDPGGVQGAGSAYIFHRSDDDWTQQAKINASDAQSSDYFGYSVSISGDYAIVGASHEDPGGADRAGSAYIFHRSGEDWTQQAKINANDRQARDLFGFSVSISGDYAIVGAYQEDPGGNNGAGSAYIFHRSGEDWTQQAKINTNDRQAGDWFGFSVSINGDYAIVGALNEDPGGVSNAGSAYIFHRENGNWTQQAKINANDRQAEDSFGWSVSISGYYAIVGAYYEDPGGVNNAGSAYIFHREDGDWTQQAKINANDRQAWDLFGFSVSISGDYAIAGANNEDPGDVQEAGSAYIYTLKGWRINITSEVGEFIHDNDNYAGTKLGASWGFDEDHDAPEPNHAPNGFIQLYFTHPEWQHQWGDNFTTDIVPDEAYLDAVIIWEFEVNTDQEGEAVILRFTPDDTLDEYSLVLRDVETDETLDLWENNTYEYDSEGGGVREFELILGDLDPPEVAVTSPNGGEVLSVSEVVQITWAAEDLTGIANSEVSYSTDNGENFTVIGAINGGDLELDWEVPDLYSPFCLVKVVCIDAVGNEGEDLSDDSFSIIPATSAHEFDSGGNLISIPLIPDDGSTNAVFGDDIGGVFWVYDYLQSRGLARTNTVSCGPGYWLATMEDVTLNVEGEAHIDTAYFELERGWNLVGDPILLSIPLASTLFRFGDETFTLDEALDAGLVQPVLYGYLSNGGNYTEEDALEPWLGYWFSVLEDDVWMLVFPVLPADGNARDETDEPSPENWQLTIEVTSANAVDLTTTLGVDVLATNGFDARFDYPEPPLVPAGSYITAFFRHDNWNETVGECYNHDIRSGIEWGDEGNWTLTVIGSDPGDVTLSWNDIQSAIPEQYWLILEDLTTGQQIRMWEVESYAYHSTGTREFQIRVSANGIDGQDTYFTPNEFSIISTYPNPFNSITVIRYGLPFPTHASLVVYNPLGQRLRTLFDDYRLPGFHTANLNADDLPSGLYFVRLEATGQVSSRKVMLIR